MSTDFITISNYIVPKTISLISVSFIFMTQAKT